jgi:hypothetical protein
METGNGETAWEEYIRKALAIAWQVRDKLLSG